MSINFHWDNLHPYINFLINSKKIAKLCFMQNYKIMADILNNQLVPMNTENNMKMCMQHVEFIIVHIWSIDIEKVILDIKKRRDELEGDYRDRVRPHLINLIRLNNILMENVKTYNTNLENLKKERIKPEFDELLLINF